MSRTLERRAEGIKAHFVNDIRLKALRESNLLRQLELYEDRLKLAEEARKAAEECHLNAMEGLRHQLEVAQRDNQQLREQVATVRSREGMVVDQRLAEEVARYNRLDTEHKLLRREASKAEVRTKALQRDLLRLQVTVATASEEAQAHHAKELKYAKEVSQLVADKSCLERENSQLAEHNAALQCEVDDLMAALEEARKVPEIVEKIATESKSVGVGTEEELTTTPAASLRAIQALPCQATSQPSLHPLPFSSSSLPSLSRQEHQSGHHEPRAEILEANIARLTRLAESLLGKDS